MIDELLAQAGSVPDPSADVLVRGRIAFASVLATQSMTAKSAAQVRSRSPRLRAAMVGVAVVASVAIAVPLTDKPTHTADAVTLISFAMPTFPFVLDPVPTGLTTPPSYSGGLESSLAVYQSDRGDIDIAVSAANPVTNLVGSPVVTLHDTTVSGIPGKEYVTSSDFPIFTLVWQAGPKRWVSLTGTHRFATSRAVHAAASALVADPQPVPLQVHLAPSGWRLRHYKDDSIVILDDPSKPDRTLTVSRTPALSADFAHAVRASSVSLVTVNGQPGQLAKAQGEWIAEAHTAAGDAFRLQAPPDLTKAQVIELAASVTAA